MSWEAHAQVMREAMLARQLARADGRYAVMEVWCDGNPVDISHHDELEDALDRRDQEIKDRPGTRGAGPTFFVYDTTDPERGWLDHDDIYDEAEA